jgi:uncharacterized protein (UPF0332 family)
VTDPNRRANLAVELEKSENSLRAADACLGLGLADDAVSRAYYAAYHMVQAVLLTEGLEAKTHAGAHDLLYLHFVRPGRVPSHLAKLFVGLQRYREQADYARAFRFALDDAREETERAREICATLHAFLDAGGWIPG